MKYHEMTKNYIFREFECGLTREQTAELCFKSVRTVSEWDKGKTIPPECKRLMRMYKGKELSLEDCWAGFKVVKGKMELPTGKRVSPQEILTAIALLEIESPSDIRVLSKLYKIAKAINSIKSVTIC